MERVDVRTGSSEGAPGGVETGSGGALLARRTIRRVNAPQRADTLMCCGGWISKEFFKTPLAGLLRH
jgi:hypothetical protein